MIIPIFPNNTCNRTWTTTRPDNRIRPKKDSCVASTMCTSVLTQDSCVASTMCADTRQLRSINHVYKCTDTRQLRSINHVYKCTNTSTGRRQRMHVLRQYRYICSRVHTEYTCNIQVCVYNISIYQSIFWKDVTPVSNPQLLIDPNLQDFTLETYQNGLKYRPRCSIEANFPNMK